MVSTSSLPVTRKDPHKVQEDHENTKQALNFLGAGKWLQPQLMLGAPDALHHSSHIDIQTHACPSTCMHTHTQSGMAHDNFKPIPITIVSPASKNKQVFNTTQLIKYHYLISIMTSSPYNLTHHLLLSSLSNSWPFNNFHYYTYVNKYISETC